MEINYELTSQDLVEFQRIVSRNDKSVKTFGRTIGYVLVSAITADFIYCLAIGLFDFNSKTILYYLIFRFLLLAGLLLLSSRVLFAVQKNMVSKIVDNSSKNGVFCEHRIILNENELIEITDVNTSRHSWVGIGEIVENEQFVIIPLNLSSSFTIPKRCFENEETWKAFIDTANEYRRNAELKFNPSHFTRFEIESKIN